MRIIGKRRFENLGLRPPTAAEIAWSIDAANHAPRSVPKGVYRYRSHRDADIDMERWRTDGMVERFQKMVGWKP